MIDPLVVCEPSHLKPHRKQETIEGSQFPERNGVLGTEERVSGRVVGKEEVIQKWGSVKLTIGMRWHLLHRLPKNPSSPFACK